MTTGVAGEEEIENSMSLPASKAFNKSRPRRLPRPMSSITNIHHNGLYNPLWCMYAQGLQNNFKHYIHDKANTITNLNPDSLN